MYTVNGPNSLSPLRTRLGWPSAVLTSAFVLPRRAPAMPRSSWMIAPAVDGASRQPAKSRAETARMRFTVPPAGGWAGGRQPSGLGQPLPPPGAALAQPHHRPAGSPANIDLVDHRRHEGQPTPALGEGIDRRSARHERAVVLRLEDQHA